MNRTPPTRPATHTQKTSLPFPDILEAPYPYTDQFLTPRWRTAPTPKSPTVPALLPLEQPLVTPDRDPLPQDQP